MYHILTQKLPTSQYVLWTSHQLPENQSIIIGITFLNNAEYKIIFCLNVLFHITSYNFDEYKWHIDESSVDVGTLCINDINLTNADHCKQNIKSYVNGVFIKYK